MDKDNFEFEVDGYKVKMLDGELTINDVMFESPEANPEDTTYILVREIHRLRQLIDERNAHNA